MNTKGRKKRGARSRPPIDRGLKRGECEDGLIREATRGWEWKRKGLTACVLGVGGRRDGGKERMDRGRNGGSERQQEGRKEGGKIGRIAAQYRHWWLRMTK